MMGTVFTRLGLTGLLAFAVTQPFAAPASARAMSTSATASATSVTTVNCRSLRGSGSYSDPLRLGTVRGTVVATGCPALTSGSGNVYRYFIFSTVRTAGRGSAAGARFRLTGNLSAVHPRLASGPVTVLRSMQHGFWTGRSPNFTGRYLPIGGLYAGTYRLGVEKLRSPLSSLSTPRFDVVIAIA
ncbi:hypothetical protein [Streptosporangium subroseum]|uniref:hypothetical protein n=1 Tax=Streptosporangium subroseum TaxID=106412 RepID=UPI003092F42F|nr:hypothetical protein OHB15_18065 [Streptosporangium subroseum]